MVVDGHHFEVATFREDGPYVDGRRPVSVHFSDIATDALRRDFTINAMFEDPVSGEILDFVGGRADLAAGHRARRRRCASDGSPRTDCA